MITEEQFKIIKEYKQLGLSISKTASALKLSTYIVKNWWNCADDDFKTDLQKQGNAIENYKQFVIEIIHITPQISTTAIYHRIQEEYPEFECSKTKFYDFVKQVREEIGVKKSKRRTTTMRAETKPAEEAQVDFGQYKIMNMYGNTVKIYFFVMILTYSRMKFAYFSSTPFTTITAIEAHEYAFKYFGGRTQNILYDLDRVFVVSENYGNIILVKKFEEYVKYRGFSACFCKGADPQSKGKVENAVNIIKRGFLDGRIYYGIDRLNSDCLNWLDSFENKKLNFITRKLPRDMFKNEIDKLIKMDAYKMQTSKISRIRRGCVSYKENQYELPIRNIKEDLPIRIEEKGKKVLLFNAQTDELLYTHNLSVDTGRIIKIDEEKKCASSTEILLRNFYKDNHIAIEYINRVKNLYPRYCYTMFMRINTLILYYTYEQLIEAFEFCLGVSDYKLGMLVGYLIYKNGTDEFNEYYKKCKKSNKSYYLNIADNIRREMNEQNR